MSDSHEPASQQPGNGSVRLVIAIATVLGALLGGGGIFGLHWLNPSVLREDPFTGSDWAERSANLARVADVALLEQRVAFAEITFVKHEEELKQELREIRIMLSEATGQLKAISAGVSSLPPPEWRKRIEALEDDRIRNDPDYRVPR